MVSAKKQIAGAVIVAAGSGQRMEGIDKVFIMLDGRPIIARVIDTFQACDSIHEIVVVLSKDNFEKSKKLVETEGWAKVKDVCIGGERRQDSVIAGLECLGRCEWVVIHDGARPLVTADIIEDGLEVAEETGAAIAAVPVVDTIKITGEDQVIQGTPPRNSLWAAQTPQVFKYDLIVEAYRKLKYEVTDDARAVELAGGSVKIYVGSNDNIKITTQDDLALAEVLIKNKK